METIEKLRERIFWLNDGAGILKANGSDTHAENVRAVAAALPTLLDELERLRKALKDIEARTPEEWEDDYSVLIEMNYIARTALQGAADV